MNNEGEEEDTVPPGGWGCACWRRLPRSVQWVIIAGVLILMLAFMGTCYIFSRKDGADGLQGGFLMAAILGPIFIVIGVTAIILAILCHERKIKRQAKADQARVELSRGGISVYNIHSHAGSLAA